MLFQSFQYNHQSVPLWVYEKIRATYGIFTQYFYNDSCELVKFSMFSNYRTFFFLAFYQLPKDILSTSR